MHCYRRFFILPWDIPGKYYPLFLACMLSIMRGRSLDLFCAVGIGYAYAGVSVNDRPPSRRVFSFTLLLLWLLVLLCSLLS